MFVYVTEMLRRNPPENSEFLFLKIMSRGIVQGKRLEGRASRKDDTLGVKCSPEADTWYGGVAPCLGRPHPKSECLVQGLADLLPDSASC